MGILPTLDRDNRFRIDDDYILVEKLRRNNPSRMTVVEQLIEIREDVCVYACKYRDIARNQYSGDVTMQKLFIQGYCHHCPLTKVHFDRKYLS